VFHAALARLARLRPHPCHHHISFTAACLHCHCTHTLLPYPTCLSASSTTSGFARHRFCAPRFSTLLFLHATKDMIISRLHILFLVDAVRGCVPPHCSTVLWLDLYTLTGVYLPHLVWDIRILVLPFTRSFTFYRLPAVTDSRLRHLVYVAFVRLPYTHDLAAYGLLRTLPHDSFPVVWLPTPHAHVYLYLLRSGFLPDRCGCCVCHQRYSYQYLQRLARRLDKTAHSNRAAPPASNAPRRLAVRHLRAAKSPYSNLSAGAHGWQREERR